MVRIDDITGLTLNVQLFIYIEWIVSLFAIKGNIKKKIECIYFIPFRATENNRIADILVQTKTVRNLLIL